MFKKLLRMTQMSNADVIRAQGLSNDLIRWESRGPGDLSNAMRRLAGRAQLPFGKLWALRYRPPKEIASHVLARIEAAHAAEKQRQLRMLAHDAKITSAITGPDHPAVRAAEALLRAPDGAADSGARAGLVAPAVEPAPAREALVNDLPLWRAMSEE